tara:strand:+ start:310 stop:516 length:207 start_codon:yes stop_codon:yes gene_type:complete
MGVSGYMILLAELELLIELLDIELLEDELDLELEELMEDELELCEDAELEELHCVTYSDSAPIHFVPS